MYSKAKIAGHPIHPMLVGFPITFYVLTLVGFVVFKTVSPDIFWYKLGYFSNYAAIITALVTAVPGFIDWALGIPNQTTAKKRGLIHMSLNLVTLALFIGNAFLLEGTWDTGQVNLGTSIFLTAVGCILLLGVGYFGREMVMKDKVGIDMTVEQENIQERYERERKEPPLFH
jgi:uncharacterized membrane protein